MKSITSAGGTEKCNLASVDTSNRVLQGMSSMSRMMQVVLAVATLQLVTACSQIDPLADKFQQLTLGDSYARVLELMGPPTSRNSVEVPLVKVEHLAWRTTRTGHVYMVLTIMNHVAAKAIID